MINILLIKAISTTNCKNELQLEIWERTKELVDKIIFASDIENLIKELNKCIAAHNAKHKRKTPCSLQYSKESLKIEISSNGFCFRAFQLVETSFLDFNP